MTSAMQYDLAHDIASRIRSVAEVSVSRLFGGAALSAQGVTFALVIAGSLYLRVDDDSRPAFEAAGSRPFSYARGTRDIVVASYWEAPGEALDDPDVLDLWAARAFRAALGAPRRKKPAPRKRTVRPPKARDG